MLKIMKKSSKLIEKPTFSYFSNNSVYKRQEKIGRHRLNFRDLLVIYPLYYETIIGFTIDDLLEWLVNILLNPEENVLPRINIEPLTQEEAPEIIYDADFVKYWIRPNTIKRRLTEEGLSHEYGENGDLIFTYIEGNNQARIIKFDEIDYISLVEDDDDLNF